MGTTIEDFSKYFGIASQLLKNKRYSEKDMIDIISATFTIKTKTTIKDHLDIMLRYHFVGCDLGEFTTNIYLKKYAKPFFKRHKDYILANGIFLEKDLINLLKKMEINYNEL